MRKAVCGVLLTLLLAGVLPLAFVPQRVKAWSGETIYIKADGSIEPSGAPILRTDSFTYTLTNNITSFADGIVVEKDNIQINGEGYLLKGSGTGTGITLLGRRNIKVTNIHLSMFETGIYLCYSTRINMTGNIITNNNIAIREDSSTNNTVSRNNIIGNGYGILLVNASANLMSENVISGNSGDGIFCGGVNNIISRNNIHNNGLGILLDGSDNVIIENNITGNSNVGIWVLGSSSNSIEGNNVVGNLYGIKLEISQVIFWFFEPHNNSVVRNNIMNNNYGVYLKNATHNSISKNTITNNGEGLHIAESSNNIISENNITNSMNGVVIGSSLNNVLYYNNITNNFVGVALFSSTNNTFYGNQISTNAWVGIVIWYSSGNKFFHNNFEGNGQQASLGISGYTNVWDDGYPSGGNYWSEHTSVDADGDGLGDTPYVIDGDNIDRYPLLVPFNTFAAGVWNGTAYNVDIITNSTVSNFLIDVTHRMISLNVSGMEGLVGFCRITIPNTIVQELWQGNYKVTLNGQPWPFKNWTDITNTYININYTHSEHQITIIPEYPSPIILMLLMSITTLVVSFAKKKQRKSET